MEDDIDGQLKAEARRELHALEKDLLRQELDLFGFYAAETGKMIQAMNAAADPEDGLAENYFEARITYSHVIYLATFLETYLKQACARFEGLTPLSETGGARAGRFLLRDIAGDKWDAPRRYLEVNLRFDFPDAWGALRALADVRNALVHDDGIVKVEQQWDGQRNWEEWNEETKKKDEQKKNRFRNLGLDFAGDGLFIPPQFIEGCLSNLRTLMDAVEKRLDEVLHRAERPRVV